MLKPLKELVGFLNGFRKWSIMFCILVIGSIFLIKKYISGAQYIDLIVPTALGFFAINGLEHFTDTVKNWLNLKSDGGTDKGNKNANG